MIRRALSLCAALLVALAAAGPAAAAASDSVTGTGCREVNAFVEGIPLEAVDHLVPEPFHEVEPQRSLGLAELFIDALACDRMLAGGSGQPGLYATVAVSVDPPPNSTSEIAGQVGPNFYLLSWVTDDHHVAKWLTDGTGLADRVQRVKGMSYAWNSVAGIAPDYRFTAPPPSRMPLQLTGVVRDPFLAEEVISNYWAVTDRGTVRIETSHPSQDNRFGASAGRVTTTPGSELAAALGGVTSRDFAGFASDFTLAQWRKAVLP